MPAWRYRLGHQKLVELGAAVGAPPDLVPGIHAAFFMFGFVPALRQVLTAPDVSPRRGDLALANVSAEWSGTVHGEADIEGTVTVSMNDDRLEARGSCSTAGSVFCTFGMALTSTRGTTPTSMPTSDTRVEIVIDAGRALAFAAATWDLNPAYWDRGFATAIGLDGPVAPPGLAAAWLVHLAESDLVGPMSAWELSFHRTPRVGETVAATFESGADGIWAHAATGEGVAVAGRFVPGSGGGHE